MTLKVTQYKEDDAFIRKISEIWSDNVDDIRFTGLHNWTGFRGSRQGAERDSVCSVLWTMIQILWDGHITVCCFDSMGGFHNMGNAHEVNISEYWTRGAGLARIRALHVARDFGTLPVCTTCNEDQYETTRYFVGTVRRQPVVAIDEADW